MGAAWGPGGRAAGGGLGAPVSTCGDTLPKPSTVMLSLANNGSAPAWGDKAAGKDKGAVGANAWAACDAPPGAPGIVAGCVGASPFCLLFHHCIDICASISSIFLIVTARSPGDVRLL